MLYLFFLLGVAAFWLIAALIMTAVCFIRIFFCPRRKKAVAAEHAIPHNPTYAPHREQMVQWILDARKLPFREVSIVSYDGLVLRGRYFECEKGAPIEILFHGYRGWGERDLSGGVFRCFALGHNALVVDQRACGASEGHVTTFGAKESRDCLAWIDFVLREIDPEAKIIITGVSMGAATVMTAAGMPLPENVVGVLADCGYTSTRAIVSNVMKDMGLPPKLLYPFARLGAILFGGFDPDARSPIQSMATCHLPIIFIHGDADDYVPATMSVENYNACVSEHKRLVFIKGAGHAIAFPVDQKGYLDALDEFFKPFL